MTLQYPASLVSAPGVWVLVGGFRNVSDVSRKFRERSAKARAKAQASIARGVLSERRASQSASLVLKICNVKLGLRGFRAGTAEVHFVYWC